MEDELRKAIGDWLNYQNEKQVELDKKYPPSVVARSGLI